MIQARNVWDEPLTDSERRVIEAAIKSGDAEECRKWLLHTLRVYEAREASRGGEANE